MYCSIFFFSSRRRHTRLVSDWSSDVCSSDLLWRARSFALSQGSSLRSTGEWKFEPSGLRAGGILYRLIRRQFKLARAHLVSGQLFARGIASKISPLLRRRFQSRVSHALSL